MLLMMAEVLEFCSVSTNVPGNAFWRILCYHQSHVEWIGCSLHDLIQPSFTFLVGVALPFSLARRSHIGQPQWQRTAHACWRAVMLVFLGILLRSVGQPQTNWTFEDTLTQIGLGYPLLYLLGFQSRRVQWSSLAFVLIAYWLAFALYPVPQEDAGRPISGFSAHWAKNTNLAWAFDTWFLNLFPREQPFIANAGGYATLSFIPTLGTMIFGLLAGAVLRGARASGDKIRWLLVTGAATLLLGILLGATGICPVVKRIWTPSWTLFSGGWCLLILAALYYVIDVRGFRRWAFVLVVIGMNSIAAYVIAHLFPGFIVSTLVTHFGPQVFGVIGSAYEPLLRGSLVLLVLWLVLFWMYRRQLFLRV